MPLCLVITKKHCDIFGILSDHRKQWQNCPRFFFTSQWERADLKTSPHGCCILLQHLLCWTSHAWLWDTPIDGNLKGTRNSSLPLMSFCPNLEKQESWGDLNSFRGTLAFQSDQLEMIRITTTVWHRERIIELNRTQNECFCCLDQKGFSFKDV